MLVSAWRISEGDVSPTGLTVQHVRRDALAGRAWILWSNGQVQGAEAAALIVLSQPLDGVAAGPPGRSAATPLTAWWRRLIRH